MKRIRGKTIFHAQNSQKNKRSIFEEKGVTLIALIVMIIIIIIIASITINVITGDDSLIEAAQTASLDSKITQYQAEVEEAFQNILLGHYALGEEATISKIADELLDESWITEATAESDNTIRVTVIDGYQYLLYYNESTGDRLIAYLGVKDSGEPVTVTIESYSNSKIEVTATCDDGISTIELIYNGDVYPTDGTYDAGGAVTATHTFSITDPNETNTGVFYIKATSTKDVLGYNFIRISSNSVSTPMIYVSSDGAQVRGWYGADGEALEVTITAENAKGIYYTLNTLDSSTDKYASGDKVTFTITAQGPTQITAYAVDSSGTQGPSASPLTVKWDNVEPTVDTSGAIYTGTKGNNNWYTTNSVIVSLETAISDTSSGPYGYKFYTENNTNNITSIIDLSEPMTVENEGETLINIIGIDTAGNESNATLTVLKDSLAPISFTPSINNISETGFTVYAGTRDNTSETDDVSGISHYNFYVGDTLYQTVYSSADGETISCDISGLEENTSYTIKVEAVDNAGNVTTASISARTESLDPPTISVEGDQGTNDWYTSDIKITITGSSNIAGIKYVITTGGSTEEKTVYTTTTSITISTDTDSYKIVAYSIDSKGNLSDPSEEVTVKRDATNPTASLSITNYDSSSIDVTASGTDSTSGIYSYKFEISTSNTFSTSTTTTTTYISSNTSYKENYTGLTSGKIYYLRVTVTDNAGNSKVSDTTSQTTGVIYYWNRYRAVSSTVYTYSTSSTQIEWPVGGQTCTMCMYWNASTHIMENPTYTGWQGNPTDLNLTNSVTIAGSASTGYYFSYGSGSSVNAIDAYSYYQGNSLCYGSVYCCVTVFSGVTCSSVSGWYEYRIFYRNVSQISNKVTLTNTSSSTTTKGTYVDTVESNSSTAYTSGAVNSDGYWYEYAGTK